MHVLWDAGCRVQRNRGPHRIDVLLRDAVAPQKVSRDVGAVYFEALILARVLRGKTHVVEHGAGIKELGIETETPALAGERTPVIDAAGVMEQQRRFRVPHEFRHLTRKLAVRDADPSDRDWRLRSPA